MYVWVILRFMKCDSGSKVFCVALANETKFFLWFLIFLSCLFLRVRYALLHCMCMGAHGVNEAVCEWMFIRTKDASLMDLYGESKYMVYEICLSYQVSVGCNQDFLTYIISICWGLLLLFPSIHLFIYPSRFAIAPLFPLPSIL